MHDAATIQPPRPRALCLLAGLLLALLTSGCAGNDETAVAPTTMRGQALYDANCASCHGLGGEGQPNWRSPDESGRFPAPPHDETGHTWHHADSALLQIIAEGGQMPDSAMPAFGDKLTPAEMAAILEYIKSFWPPEIQEAQADMTRRTPE